MSYTNNISIKATDVVHTYDYSGDIGSLLVEAGIEPAAYYSVDFCSTSMGGVRIDTVHDEDTNDLLWAGTGLYAYGRWSDDDDTIIEALEAYIYNVLEPRETNFGKGLANHINWS
jgi:hypothetical protein